MLGGGLLIREKQRLAGKHREREALRAVSYVVAEATTYKDGGATARASAILNRTSGHDLRSRSEFGNDLRAAEARGRGTASGKRCALAFCVVAKATTYKDAT